MCKQYKFKLTQPRRTFWKSALKKPSSVCPLYFSLFSAFSNSPSMTDACVGMAPFLSSLVLWPVLNQELHQYECFGCPPFGPTYPPVPKASTVCLSSSQVEEHMKPLYFFQFLTNLLCLVKFKVNSIS